MMQTRSLLSWKRIVFFISLCLITAGLLLTPAYAADRGTQTINSTTTWSTSDNINGTITINRINGNLTVNGSIANNANPAFWNDKTLTFGNITITNPANQHDLLRGSYDSVTNFNNTRIQLQTGTNGAPYIWAGSSNGVINFNSVTMNQQGPSFGGVYLRAGGNVNTGGGATGGTFNFSGTNNFTNLKGGKIRNNGEFVFKSGSTTTFSNCSIELHASDGNGVWIIEDGATLIFDASTITGKNSTPGKPIFLVKSGGTLEFKNTAKFDMGSIGNRVAIEVELGGTLKMNPSSIVNGKKANIVAESFLKSFTIYTTWSDNNNERNHRPTIYDYMNSVIINVNDIRCTANNYSSAASFIKTITGSRSGNNDTISVTGSGGVTGLSADYYTTNTAAVTVSVTQNKIDFYDQSITYDSNGNYRITNTIQPRTVLNITWQDPASYTYTGSTIVPTIKTIKTASGSDVTSTFRNQITVTCSPVSDPTDVGSYTATAKLSTSAAIDYSLGSGTTKSFSITKADPVKTDPTAKTGLTYSGSPLDLINAGSSSHGKFMYKDPATGSWSESVPQAVDAGNYVVEYYFIGDKNHNDAGSQSNTQKLNVAIAAAELIQGRDYTAPTLISEEGLPYTGEMQDLITAGETRFGELLYALDKDAFIAAKAVSDEDYSGTIPQGKDAGTYSVYWKIVPDANHVFSAGAQQLNPEIIPGNLSQAVVEITNLKDLVMNGRLKTLEFTVTYHGLTLIENVDFIIEEGTNTGKEPGTYTLILTGINNFIGSGLMFEWQIFEPDTYKMQFYPIEGLWDRERNCPTFGCGREMPATGFPTRITAPLSIRPQGLNYKDLKMRLQIPSLDLDTELIGVPEDGNSWAVEWIGDKAGVLSGTALPGEGYSLIAGHNHLDAYQTGPFLALGSLNTGDKIFVNRANGSMISFTVYANELLGPNDMQAMAQIAEEKANTLVLVTCENEAADGGYLNRRVIFAAPQ